ncbi:MAG: sigma-70 family RNA polymerase sigma factor [Sphingomonadaceae bacterium]
MNSPMAQGSTAASVDDAAFKAQMVALIPSLRAFARSLSGNPDMADDLAQEAMSRAWRARASFVMGTNFRAWMFMILRNIFYTTIRKNSRMVSWDPEVAERILVEPATQHAGIELHDVQKALNKLPATQREMLMLVAAEGVSYEEAATIAGCAVGTVKSRVARARAALVRLLEGEGNELNDALERERAPLSSGIGFGHRQ